MTDRRFPSTFRVEFDERTFGIYVNIYSDAHTKWALATVSHLSEIGDSGTFRTKVGWVGIAAREAAFATVLAAALTLAADIATQLADGSRLGPESLHAVIAALKQRGATT